MQVENGKKKWIFDFFLRTILSLVKSYCKKLKAEQLKCDLYFKGPS